MSRASAAAWIVGVLVVSGHAPFATASVSRWSEPQVLMPDGATWGNVGVDDSGRITAVWHDGRDGVVRAATREPGSRLFSSPQQLSAGGGERYMRVPTLAVSGTGHAVVTWPEEVCDAAGCSIRLIARGRFGGQAFGTPQVVSNSAQSAAVAVNDSGDAVIGWFSRDRIWFTHRVGASGRFAPPQLADDTGRAPWRLPAVALGADGDALIAWARGEQPPYGPGSSIMAVTRRGRGAFTGPQVVFDGSQGAQGYDPDAMVGPGGEMVVAYYEFAHRFPPDTMVSHREEGRFTSAVSLGPGGGLPHFAGRGPRRVLWWESQQSDQTLDMDVWVSVSDNGSRFPPGEKLFAFPAAQSQFAVDRLGNLVGLWTMPYRDDRLRATTFTGLDIAEPVQAVTPYGVTVLGFDANPGGAAAALLYVASDPGQPVRLELVTRPPDHSPPAITSRALARASGSIVARVRCDEPCRVAARGRLPGGSSGKRKRAVIAAGRTIRLRPALRPRARARLRRLVAAGHRPEVVVSIRAQDGARNARRLERRVAVRK